MSGTPRIRRFVAYLILFPALSCGGDDAVEPSVPTSLGIEPAQVIVAVGGEAMLGARVLDQHGGTMSSADVGAVVWSSSDTTRLTVDGTGLVRGIRPGLAAVSAMLGTIRGEAPVTVLAPSPQVETGRSASVRMGTGGGVVEVESSTGVRYALEVPPAGLLDSTTITLAPVGTIENSPFVGLLGAVRMEPDGLTFFEPARLTITLPTAPPDPDALIGLHFSSDGSEYGYRPVQADGRDVEIYVPHFSGAGVFGPPPGLIPPVSQATGDHATRIAIELHEAAVNGVPLDVAGVADIYKEWYNDVVRPGLVSILAPGVTDEDVYGAILEWRVWLIAIDASGLGLPLHSLLATELTEGPMLATNSLRHLIDLLNARCVVDRDPFLAARVFAIQYAAETAGLDTPGSGLDRNTVMQSICMAIDLKVTLPISLSTGQPFDLEINAGAIFGGQFRNELIPLDIGYDASGTTTPGLTSVPWQGPVTTVPLTPTGSGDVDIFVDVCPLNRINPPTLLDVTDICDDEFITTGVDPWYANDFRTGAPGSEWRISRTTTSPSGERYLGEFTTEVVNLRLTGIPDHEEVRIQFDFHTISDWEGSAPPSIGGTDIVTFAVGRDVQLRTTFSTKPGFPQAYPGSYPGGPNNPPMYRADARNRLGYPDGSGHTGDATYGISFTVQHTQSELTFSVQASLDATDPTTGERWGLDNIRVFLIN